jgi:hypothetical protein
MNLFAVCILRSFENRVLRRIYGPKREEVAGGWRTLHNEELHNLYTCHYGQGLYSENLNR